MLAEVTQCEEEVISFSEKTFSDLLKFLFKKYPLLQSKEFKIVENLNIVTKSNIISNTEIALLPPFAGG